MLRLVLRPVMQASRSLGSIGQGASLFFQSIRPLSDNIAAENANTCILCSDTQMSAGTFEATPASTAPKPKLTSRVGKAQQIKVLIEPKSVK